MTSPSCSVNNSHTRNSFREYILAFAVCVMVSATAILPFFRIGEARGAGCCGGSMPVTHDMVMHLNQMQSFYEGLTTGRLYPRWDGRANRGFGAPTTIFYPPLTYYISSLLYFVTRDWMVVIVLFYLLVMVASGMAFFALALSLYGRWAAIFGAALYLVTPYHLLNHYQRGALAECLSFVFIPLMALSLLKLTGREQSRQACLRWTATLSLTWGLFLWSHPPTAYQFLLIAVPVLTVVTVVTKRWRGLLWIGSAVLCGTMISGAYLLPAVSEQKAVHSDDVERSWPYHESYVLKFNNTRYDHYRDDFVVRVDRIWTYTTILLVVCGLVLAYARREASAFRGSWDLCVWLSGSLLASFMMLPASSVIGAMIPRIEIGVFAWRMLAITSMGMALLGAGLAAMSLAGQGAVSARAREALRVALVACSVTMIAVSVVQVIFPMYRAEAFSPNPNHSNYALVPAAGMREQPFRTEASVLDGKGTATIKLWEPENRVIDIELRERGITSLRLFNYPGWTAKNGKLNIPLRTGSIGEVEVELPAGKHELVLEFRNTPARKLGTSMSIVGLLSAVGMCALSSQRLTGRSTDRREA